MLLDLTTLGKELAEAPFLWVHPRIELLNTLLQRQGSSTRLLDRLLKSLDSRVQALHSRSKVVQKLFGLPSLGVDGNSKAVRGSVTFQIEMLTGRIGTAKDTGSASKVPEQIPSLCNHVKACQIILVLLPQENEALTKHLRI